MRDDRQNSRLRMMVGGPVVALTAVAVATIVVGAASGAGAGVVVVGVIGLLLAAALGAFGLQQLGADDDTEVEVEPPGPSEELTGAVAAASELARVRIPALASAVADSGSTDALEQPFDVPAGDETAAQLVGSLNQIQTSVSSMVDSQDQAIREGIGQLVVNLVRRNQSLLDKQLEQIDELETSEEDPERLEQLYGLDLLSTRMRRNAESLLVLAGTEPPRRRNGEVSVSDIARVAVSEIEKYRQVEFRSVDSGVVVESAVVDLAHLLSELLENATKFSPPDAKVGITGSSGEDGAYRIEVVDAGIGIAEDKLAELNLLLAEPPELGLDMSRSLGLMVVGKLAQRWDLKVELKANDPAGKSVGTTAVVHLPAELLVAEEPEIEEPMVDEVPITTDLGDIPAEPLAVRDRSSRPADTGGSLFGQERGPADAPAEPAPVVQETAPEEQVTPEEPVTPRLDEPAEVDGSASSDALSRLLGVEAPTSEQAPTATPQPEPAAPATETRPTEPPRETAPVDGRIASLEEALPSGIVFDSGVESLLEPAADAPTTSKGLVKRDRSKNYAPVGEGRQVPNASAAPQSPVAASNRKPEEIKQMLSRYRDARRRPVQERAAQEAAGQPTNETPQPHDQGETQ